MNHALSRTPARRVAVLATAFALLASGGVALADFEAGLSYFKSGKYPEAAMEFQALVEQAPEYDYGHYILGLSFLKMDKPNDAVESLRKAIELNPDKFEYYHGLANAYLATKNFRKVAETLEKGEGLVTDETRYHFNLTRGQAYFELDRWSEAISDLKKAVAVKPQPGLWSQIGTAFWELNDYANAADAFKKVAKAQPNNTANQQFLALSLLNAAARAQGKTNKEALYRESLEWAETYYEARKGDFEAANIAGRAALGAGKYQQSVDYFDVALRLKPSYCPAMVNKSRAHIQLEDYAAAEADLTAAAACDPRMGITHEQLGFVYRKLDKLEKALEAYKKAQSIKASPAIAKAIEEVRTNIEVKQHNAEMARKEAEQKAAIEAEQRRLEEEKKKLEEWKRKQEDQ